MNWFVDMEIIGFSIPLWAVFIIVLLVVIIAWKLIKFALKFLLILVVIFLILIGLDMFQVFDKIQSLLATII